MAGSRGWLAWAAALVASMGMAIAFQFQLAKVPPVRLDVNMLFVPPAQLTERTASGYQNLIADGLWLGLIQYYGDRVVKDDKRCVNLVEMFGLITDLDPRFYFAYWLGAWAIADNHQIDDAIALLHKGARANPGDYNYPYLEGFIRFLDARDLPGAAKCFMQAADMPGAPRFARTMGARMLETEGQDDLALSIWQNLAAKAPDKATRQIAANNVTRILADRTSHRESIFVRWDRLQRKKLALP